MSGAARGLRERGKQVDYTDLFTPEDPKKRKSGGGGGGGAGSSDDDDSDDVVLKLKKAPTAAAATAATLKSKENKAKEPVKKKSSSAPPVTTARESKKTTKKRSHADDDDSSDGEDVFEKKAKKMKVKAKKSESDGKDKQKESAMVVKKKPRQLAEPKEKPAAKDKERKRENESSNGAAKPGAKAKKVLSLSKPTAPSSSTSDDSSDVTALRKKYDALKQLRETESERLLQDARALAQEEKKTYERMIAKLKKEVSSLSSRLQDDQIKREKEIEKLQTENQLRLESLERKYSSDDGHGQRKRIKELEAQLKEARKHTKASDKASASRSGSKAAEENLQLAQATKLLEIYRLVTATDIRLIQTLEDDDDTGYTDVSCTTVDSNSGRQFHYDLGVPEDEDDEIEYLPSEAPNEDVKMPSYLQDELSFKRPEMTKFMRTILDVVIRKQVQSASDARSKR